jgi:hypothetical protein
MEGIEVFSEQGLLAVTCLEDELPKAESVIEYVREFMRELQVGDLFKSAKVRPRRC